MILLITILLIYYSGAMMMMARTNFINKYCPPSLKSFALKRDETRAELICDSIFKGVRITTLSLRFPRFILPQMNTHRVFSRNSASSRAIPTKRYITESATYCPIFWNKNKAGMTPGDFLPEDKIIECIKEWEKSRRFAIEQALFYVKDSDCAVAKERANRLLEPFAYVNYNLTSVHWDNFFNQRLHHDAQLEIRLVAELMNEAINNSVPIERPTHLPYITQEDLELEQIDDDDVNNLKIGDERLMRLIRKSVARCARVSYSSDFENNKCKLSSQSDDDRLHDFLIKSNPPHLSPAEHVAFANINDVRDYKNFKAPWVQYRSIIAKNI